MLIVFYCIQNFQILRPTQYVILLNQQIDKELMSSLLRNNVHRQHKVSYRYYSKHFSPNKMLSNLHYSSFKIAYIVIWSDIISLFQMNGQSNRDWKWNSCPISAIFFFFFFALHNILKNVFILKVKWLFLPVASSIGPEPVGKRGTEEVISLQGWCRGN